MNKEFIKNNADMIASIAALALILALCISLRLEVKALHLDDISSVKTAPETTVEEVVESIPETTAVEIVERVETEPTTEEIVEETTAEPIVAYYDVPLSDDLQDHIFEVCESYQVDPKMVIAMIGVETKYGTFEIGDNGQSYGLMQVQPRWHSGRMSKLGVTDLLDPYQNILVAVDFIAELQASGKSTTWVLMAYNGGHGHANKLTSEGRISTYASDVLDIYYGLSWR